ncbi:MAG TPA: hypothetical protein VGK74_16325 [Symbiobacteriaceae bacterium]|jgi:hypothetical protein
MDDENRGPESDPKARRFRVGRRVKNPPAEPYADQMLREVAQDDADRGTPEMNRGVTQGCSGCAKVALLFFAILAASLVANCAIRR